VEDLAPCELLNGDVASLVEVNFGNKSLVSCGYCIYLVPIDLEFFCADLRTQVVVLAKITCRSLLVSLCNF
jgi:hypothetical protein